MPVTIKHAGALVLCAATAGVLCWSVRDDGTSSVTEIRHSKMAPLLQSRPQQTEPRTPEDINQRRWRAALAKIDMESDPQRRREALEELVTRPTDFAIALNFLLTDEQSKLAHEAGLRLLRHWAESDPLAAAAWLNSATVPEKLRGEAINQTALAWVGENFAEVISWVEGLPVETEKNGAVLQVAYESTRSAPMDALRLAAKLPAGTERDALVEHAVSEWTTSAPTEAAAWAKGMVEGEMKDRTMVAVITAWSDTDPVSAADMAVQTLPAGRSQDDAVMGIVQRWVQKEPKAAMAWVERFPEGALRDSALESIAQLRPTEVVETPVP